MRAYELRDSFPFTDKNKGDLTTRDAFIRDYGNRAVDYIKEHFEDCDDINVNDISNMIGCYDRFMSDVINDKSFRYIRLESICCISPKYSIISRACRGLDFRRRCGKIGDIGVRVQLAAMYSFLWNLYIRSGKYYLSEEFIELRRDYKVQAKTGDNSGTSFIRRHRLVIVLFRVMFYICKYFKSHQEAIDYAKENYEASSLYQELSVRYCRTDKSRYTNRKSKGKSD